MKKAAFFDRDGTLIIDKHYLSRLEDIELMPTGIALARWCQEQGYLLFVVTNQSGIARGFFTEQFVHQTHQVLDLLLQKEKIKITKYYLCPHGPNDMCLCRKPAPGMLLQAAQEFNLDLQESLVFGDSDRDVHAGQAVGCRSYNIMSFNGGDLNVICQNIAKAGDLGKL
jgi:D-glycero-D-manno-heptose 1,7-bisphosphate phosphatase